jgi:hypothetical protein
MINLLNHERDQPWQWHWRPVSKNSGLIASLVLETHIPTLCYLLVPTFEQSRGGGVGCRPFLLCGSLSS